MFWFFVGNLVISLIISVAAVYLLCVTITDSGGVALLPMMMATIAAFWWSSWISDVVHARLEQSRPTPGEQTSRW